MAAVLSLAGAAQAAETRPFVFTAIPDQDETRLVERFSTVAVYLEEKLGVPVKYVPVKSYPAAVTAFINGEVQLAWFGGFTGVRARLAQPGARAIAQGAEDARFKSLMIANVASGLKPSPDFPKAIEGKSFSFGARASTSGRVMRNILSGRRLAAARPTKCFARSVFPATILARSRSCSPAPMRLACSIIRSGSWSARPARSMKARSRSFGKLAIPGLPMDRARRY